MKFRSQIPLFRNTPQQQRLGAREDTVSYSSTQILIGNRQAFLFTHLSSFLTVLCFISDPPAKGNETKLPLVSVFSNPVVIRKAVLGLGREMSAQVTYNETKVSKNPSWPQASLSSNLKADMQMQFEKGKHCTNINNWKWAQWDCLHQGYMVLNVSLLTGVVHQNSGLESPCT